VTQTETETKTSPVGRPRSDQVRRAVLASVLKLVQEGPLSDVTIKSIAQEANVGRQTIYRWWGSRGEIILEALLEFSARRVRKSHAGTPEEAALRFIRDTVKQAGIAKEALAAVMIDAQLDTAFLERFRSEFVEVRRSAFMQIISELEASSLSESEMQFAADMVYGPLWYRLLVGHAPLNKAFADQMAQTVLDWIRTRNNGAGI